MSVKLRKVLSLALIISLLFQQVGFAQIAGELNISGYLSRIGSNLAVEKFRPPELRYFSYDSLNDNFKVLLDKGDLEKGLSPKGTVPEEKLQEEAKTLLSYFLVGVSLPDSMFWVNLRPDSEGQIIDQYLEKTDVGRIMLEADLQLKKDTASMTSPTTPEGKEYWDKLYKKAAGLYGYDNVTIPTLTRPWIVPGEIIVRESRDSAYIYKATLKVMLEQDYLKDSSTYNFQDTRSRALNEYSSQLIRELIIPKLTKEVNSSERYAPLRQVYYSLILSRWFKLRFSGKSGTYASLINTKDLTNLISKGSWSKTTYFKAYQKSFKDGEYNIQEPFYTPTGQAIRSYFSGGISWASSAINTQNGVINGSRMYPFRTPPLRAYCPITGNARTGSLMLQEAQGNPGTLKDTPVLSGEKTASSAVDTFEKEIGLMEERITGDYYKILGVDRQAGKEAIKKAYRGLIIRWHPDKNGDAFEEMKARIKNIAVKLNDAYEVLSDPEKRRKYDSTGAFEFSAEPADWNPAEPDAGNDDFQDAGYYNLKDLKTILDELDGRDPFDKVNVIDGLPPDKLSGMSLENMLDVERLVEFIKKDPSQFVRYRGLEKLEEIVRDYNYGFSGGAERTPKTIALEGIIWLLENDQARANRHHCVSVLSRIATADAIRALIRNILRADLDLGGIIKDNLILLADKEKTKEVVTNLLTAALRENSSNAAFCRIIRDILSKAEPAAGRAEVDKTLRTETLRSMLQDLSLSGKGEDFVNEGRLTSGIPSHVVVLFRVKGRDAAHLEEACVLRDELVGASFGFMKVRAREFDPSVGAPKAIAVYHAGGDSPAWQEEQLKEVRKWLEAKVKQEQAGSLSSAAASSAVNEAPVKTGGIDFRVLPMAIQPMGSFAGLNFKLPQLSQAELKQIDIDSEMRQLKNMVQSGIAPSGRRIKELIAACIQKREMNSQAGSLLLCIADIFKLEEESASESSPELREALVIVDSQA
ncbi:MAG: DnaJ domain-containing protein [Candidatus Omnitrophota bacterium]